MASEHVISPVPRRSHCNSAGLQDEMAHVADGDVIEVFGVGVVIQGPFADAESRLDSTHLLPGALDIAEVVYLNKTVGQYVGLDARIDG